MIPFAVLNSLVSDVKKGSLRVNSVMILVVLSTHAELASATARGRSYWETGQGGGGGKARFNGPYSRKRNNYSPGISLTTKT